MSPFTQSATIAIAPGTGCTACSPSISVDIGLTLASQNCSPAPSGLTCAYSTVLAPGSYTGSITTYDGPVGCQPSHCNELSTDQSFPVTIAAGQANAPAISLYGVPANLKLFAVSSNATTRDFGAFSVFRVGGLGASATALAYASDLDGATIVGPGAPSFAISTAASAGWTSTMSGNALTVTAPSTTSFGSPAMHLVASSPACQETAALCHFDVLINPAPILAIADTANSTVHVVITNTTTGKLTPYATVTSGVSSPSAVAFDKAGDLVVLNPSNVAVYAPPYTGAPKATIAVFAPTTMAVDNAGDVAVATSFFGNYAVAVYRAPGYGASTETTTLSNAATALAFDWKTSDLFVAQSGNVSGYSSPYFGSPASPSLSISNPAGMDFDSSGDLFVSDSVAGTLTQYTSPAFGLGSSVSSLNTPGPVAGSYLGVAVCTIGGALSYATTSTPFTMSAVFPYFNVSSPCEIAMDYNSEMFAGQSVKNQVWGVGTDSFLSYNVNAIAVYPTQMSWF